MRSASAIDFFNHEHPCLVRFRRDRVSHARDVRSRVWRPLEGVASRRRTIEEPSVFTTPDPLRRAGGLRSMSSLERGGVFFLRSFAIGRASGAPVAPPAMRRLERSLSQRPTPENDAEIVGRRFREESAALRPSAPSVERCFFISTTSCDAAPRGHTGLGPLTASSLGSARFCRRVTGHFALSNRLDSTPLFDGESGCRP